MHQKMSDCRKFKYEFFEKFFRELFENEHNVDFFYINTTYNTLTNEMRALFLGTLLSFEDNSFLFTITKQKLLNILKSVLVDVSKGEPKKIKTFQNYIDIHKYKKNLAENMALLLEKKGFLIKGQKSNNIIEIYKKWSEIDYVMVKTELELALIFIDQLRVIEDFYSFIENFESGIFFQYLENIKNLVIELSKYRYEG